MNRPQGLTCVTGFQHALDAAFALPKPPHDLADLAIYGLENRSPTEDDLTLLTERVIELERRVSTVPEGLDGIDQAGNALNLAFTPHALAHAERDANDYRRAIKWLGVLRSQWVGYQAEAINMLSTMTAARANVEHILGWEAYVRDVFRRATRRHRATSGAGRSPKRKE